VCAPSNPATKTTAGAAAGMREKTLRRRSETQISFALNFACRLWWPSKILCAAAIDASTYNHDCGTYGDSFSQPEYDPAGPIHQADMEYHECRGRYD